MATIEIANPNDWSDIVGLLHRSGLREDGLSDHLATTLVAHSGGAIIGSAALEVYGTAALLRSVAVESPQRGHGLGHRLTQEALDLARQRGCTSVYLLTQTAADFFARFGFQRIMRDDVPAPVHTSIEFQGMCPSSATVMGLALVDRPATADSVP